MDFLLCGVVSLKKWIKPLDTYMLKLNGSVKRTIFTGSIHTVTNIDIDVVEAIKTCCIFQMSVTDVFENRAL